jgi:ubiquinone/menaquinone biosynthesis C-methylase UbiE
MWMGIKSKLLKLYYWPCNSPQETNRLQKIIRDTEWESISAEIKKGNFLDVGCGAGYSLLLAQKEGNTVFGVDPSPGSHGVGRQGSAYDIKDISIQQAYAEKLPFPDGCFDTVYSSHVLEHVNDTKKTLQEMSRVLHADGVLIIGVPTADMAKLNLLTSLLFTTHFRWVNFFLSPFINTSKTHFFELFLPRSHSREGSSVLYDMKNYRVDVWRKLISQTFQIHKVILPAYYPYPEFLQLFKLKKNHRKSSSVFFVCSK